VEKGKKDTGTGGGKKNLQGENYRMNRTWNNRAIENGEGNKSKKKLKTQRRERFRVSIGCQSLICRWKFRGTNNSKGVGERHGHGDPEKAKR